MVTPVLFFSHLHRIEQKGEKGVGKNKKRSGSKLSAALTGVICAVGICLVGLAGMTQMMQLNKIGERGIQVMIPGLLFLSALVGCLLAVRTNSTNLLVVIICTVCCFAVLLLALGLSIDGSFDGVLQKLGAIVGGGGISCVLCLKKPRKNWIRKRAYR